MSTRVLARPGPADGREAGLESRAGDLLVVPNARHALQAVQDGVVLLTVSKAAPARHP